jgi:hypothetical protein
MKQHGADTLRLVDADHRWIGNVEIEYITGNLIYGTFTPGSDFPAVADIFQRFEDAVNVQALSVVDALDVEIAALGLCLCLPDKTECIDIHDVQIWRDGNISCQLPNASSLLGDSTQKSSVNGHPLETAHLR